MATVQVEVAPEEVGLDPERLPRIDRHFKQYVDDGRLPGWLVLVARRGKVAYLSTYGKADRESGTPVRADTLFRIYSMTKPITSVAAMMLVEQAALELTDPVERFIPAFADMRLYVGGPPTAPTTRPATEPIRIWHLLTHTSGMTYGFQRLHPVDAMHRALGFELSTPPGCDLAECCERWATVPLLFDPGTAWNYGVSTDVLGRVVEVVSGRSLDSFFREHILDPLDMRDTSFEVDPAASERLATLYTADTKGKARRANNSSEGLGTTKLFSGGAGLHSTARDYHRFLSMLLGGGALDGVRLLGDHTVRYMLRNHLPGGADLETLAQGAFSEATNAGKGFGLGFAVVEDPVAGKIPTSAGEFSWGGLASTAFWADPAEELSVVFLTQLIPSSTHPIRSQLRQLVYQALVE